MEQDHIEGKRRMDETRGELIGLNETRGEIIGLNWHDQQITKH